MTLTTLPRGERHGAELVDYADGYISIHAPAKGATPTVFHFCFPYYISIHAPAKGATNRFIVSTILNCISIHAPAKGATGDDADMDEYRSNFNPRSREGSDIPPDFLFLHCTAISIHAPAKGATRQTPLKCIYGMISIHAPAKGATYYQQVWEAELIFQSTLPRRERRCAACRNCDIAGISIHAPAKGATQT